MEFKTADYMRKLVKEKKEKDFPYELYNIIIKDIEHDAKKGLTSHKYYFSTSQINKDIKSFYNLRKDWKILSKKLYELGFQCSSDIQFYDPLQIGTTYHITIGWET